MSNFQNEFSWSPSRHRMFDSCKRQYYYNYYGSWGGWYRDADPQIQLLYRLKKMTSIPQLVGTVVHDAISRILKALQSGRDVPPPSLETYARKLFDQHLRDSKQQRWLHSASKYTNLFEHYYAEPFSEADQKNASDRIASNLSAFFASKPYSILQTTLPEHYLSIEKLTSFTFANTKLWVSLDVAVRRKSGIYVFDWKTGRERSADRHQLAVYALYATTQWGVALSDLQLQDVYLQSDSVSKVDLSSDDLDQTRTFVTESTAAMRALLDDPEQNTASQDTFPMTDNTHLCNTCPFKAVCYPNQKPIDQPTTQQEPVQLSLF
jgi:CRISPR/Cas system-associated exonuclease Cas4 (RecB family)